jgi:4-amino-4-deoxy-L-arabinose transferase-like glycosyltransferase
MIDPVFYQAWLSFVAKFTLDIPLLVGIYSGLLSAVTPWLWYRFLRELLPRKRQALIGWAIFAWLPSWIGIYSYFMTETLLLPLLGAAFWLSWRAMRKRDCASLVGAAVIWTLAALTRGIAAPLAAVLILFAWWRQSNRVKAAISITVIAVIVLLPLSYRSWVKTGMISPLGQAALNEIYARSGAREIKVNYYSDYNVGFLYGFASPSTGSHPFAPFSDYTSSRRGTVNISIDISDQANSWRSEKTRLLEQAPPWFKLVPEELIFLFFGSSWPDNNPERVFELLSTWFRFVWLPAYVAAMILLISLMINGERRHAPPLAAVLIVWLFIQGTLLLVVNEGRYRKPGEGVIIASLLAGIFLRRRDDSRSHSAPQG